MMKDMGWFTACCATVLITLIAMVSMLPENCAGQCQWCATGGDVKWQEYCKASDWSKIP